MKPFNSTNIKKPEIIQNPKPSPELGFWQSFGKQMDNLVTKGWERDARGTNAVKALFVKPEEPAQLKPLV